MEEVTKVLPAVALRGTTILPDMIVHFDISRPKSVRAVEEAMLGNQKIFLITQKDPDTEVPGPRVCIVFMSDWIALNETQVEYLIPGREDAAACLTDSSEIAEDRLDGEEEFHAYSYAAVVAAVADSSYIETDDAQGGTNIVLDVANQPVKHQNKMLVIILGIGILAVGIIAGLAIKRKQRK